MHSENPFQLFSPIHPAWLYRRHAKKLDVTTSDLDSIELHHPQVVLDPLFAKYRRLANAGKLYRRRGRKPTSIPVTVRLWAARFAIDHEKEAIWKDRRSGKRERQRSDESPIHEAANAVAIAFRLGSGRSLLNCLSREHIL